jgi:mono/diheme cytochrome c family protein
MVAQYVRNLSDDDITAVIAYLRSTPPVVRAVAPERFTFLAIVLAGAGALPTSRASAPAHIAAPPKAATIEYGAYVVSWASCRECHGEQLRGGKSLVFPHGPDLRMVTTWTREQFVRILRTGVDPFGKQLDNALMPWGEISRLDNVELEAIHAYLASRPTGS